MKKIVNAIEKLNESEQRIFLNDDGSNKDLLDLRKANSHIRITLASLKNDEQNKKLTYVV